MALSEAVSKCLKCPGQRVTLVDDASIKEGGVIFFAAWSAPAPVAVEAYSERLNFLSTDPPVWATECRHFV